MSHAIIRGANGRRHEVDFGDDPVRVTLLAGAENLELVIEAEDDHLPEGKRRFAILNLPRHQFSEAMAALAKSHPVKGV